MFCAWADESVAAHAVDQACPLLVDFRPAKPVHESGLGVARQELRALGVRQAKIVGDRAMQGRDGPLLAVGRPTERRGQHFVEGGNGHSVASV